MRCDAGKGRERKTDGKVRIVPWAGDVQQNKIMFSCFLFSILILERDREGEGGGMIAW